MRNRSGQAALAVRIERVPVLLRNLQRAIEIDMKRLRGMAESILAAMHAEDAELSILLVSDRRIRALNACYRKKDRATDVMAFPLDAVVKRRLYPPFPCTPSSALPPRLLGDVVISLPTAQRQARDLGHGLHEEVIRLLVHGVLHLLGYDHERGPREAARMARQERRVLRIVAAA